jgi:hypothetical protein
VAAPDGTFGNRFDDPDSTYRVIYASSQRLGCFLETLARFRCDLSLIAELREIAGDDDHVPLGTVPATWLDTRVMGSAATDGRYADVGTSEWIAYLRRQLARQCVELGIEDLDAAALHRTAPRRFTQLVSREVYARAFDGIAYRSKYGYDLENWAVFEPFRLAAPVVDRIQATDGDFQGALRIHRLRLG